MRDDGRKLDINEIEDRITAFIQRELLTPDMSVGRNEDLLSGELLDSIAVLRLATFVDQEFAISMQTSDFVVENFQTVAVLARYVMTASSPADPGRVE